MQTIQQLPSWFSKQKLSGKVAIGCAGFFMLCCLCSVPYAILNPSTPTPIAQNTSVAGVESSPIAAQTESEVEVVPTATTESTNTPEPTNTLEPTNTPLPPTPTQNPTVTDEPIKENDQEILTLENNEDMAALFKVGDSDPFVSEFAKKYAGRTIQFDGYIANMMPHEGSKTRFDILIYTGNYGEKSGNALSFKFEDVNIVYDLKLTGSNIPEYISEGQNLRITAIVEEYKEISGLFFLKPVSTEIR